MREQLASGPWFAGSHSIKSDHTNILAGQEGKVVNDDEEENEVLRLKELLKQREAANLRLEGENFVLNAQVQQLQQQAMENSKDAQTCQSQLAQAQQVLDSSVQGRMPMKTDIDQVRAIVASARRSLRRLAGTERGSTGRGAAQVSMGGSVEGAPKAATNAGTLPRSPRGEQRQLLNAGPKEARRSPGRRAGASSPGRNIAAAKPSQVSAWGTGGTGATELEALPGCFAAGFLASRAVPQMSNDVPEDALGKDCPWPTKTGGSPKERPVSTAPSGDSGAHTSELAELREMFLRQRMLLMAALKKGSELATLQDDLIRRDVIIHNLKQEQQLAQQEAQNQQQLFEHQMQQLQHEHQLQQLQQVQQMQQLESLLHQRHQLQLAQRTLEVPLAADDALEPSSSATPVYCPPEIFPSADVAQPLEQQH
eukprot:TRINITY_DN33331_c0_g1_i1.p1 TRINITY_DN33331_c0_g1~~TRINITY_DN33331_c0_g1_i1.p1  ORF type:complete len:461 (+),score=114.47 TRINITY_DN33331_c0_g1_i1:114-1385(+)